MTRNGLVGWWPFSETSGDATDYSGRGIDLTVNGATRGVEGRAGVQGYSFDGTDDYLQNDSFTDVFGTADEDVLTISAWMRPTSVAFSNPAVPFGINKSDGTNRILFGFQNDQNASIFDDGTGTTYTGSEPLTVDEWNHVVWQYRNSDDLGRIYVNNTQALSINSITAPIATSDKFYIATEEDSGSLGNYYGGLISDVRAYQRVLNEAEIDELYRQGSADLARPPDDNNGGVSYWTLDESSGDALDEWGTNDGTLNGGVTQGADGIRGTAYSFDGTDDYVDTNSGFPLDGTNSQSICFWINADDVSTTQGIIGINESTGGIIRLLLSSGSLAYNLRKENNTNYTQISQSVVTNEWYHAVGVYDNSASEMRLYVNGKLADTTIFSDTVNTNTNWYFGGESDSDTTLRNPFNGTLDDVRIYDRALNANEVHRLYRYGTRGIDLRSKLIEAK